MKAVWRDQVIAESDRTLEVDGYRYFPRETVRMDLLRRMSPLLAYSGRTRFPPFLSASQVQPTFRCKFRHLMAAQFSA